MLKIHHLNDSRSQRILWLLEELEVPYEIIHYERHPETRLGQEDLHAVHPLGKSPVLEDGSLKLHESGAIVDYLIRNYGKGRLQPKEGNDDFARYTEWMHYAEGSAMLPLLLNLYTTRMGATSDALQARIASEMKNHFSFVDQQLAGQEFFVGGTLTGADIMMSFPLEAIVGNGLGDAFPNIKAFVARIHKSPTYLAALEKGGAYVYGPKSA